MPDAPRSERLTLRALAVFKFFKACLLILIAIGAFRYLHRDLEAAAEKVLNYLRADPNGRWFNALLAKCANVSPKRLKEVGAATAVYGVLYLIEGVGLWLYKPWAEWLALISTSLPLPFETYEVIKHARWARVITLVINLAIVVYLVVLLWRKHRRGRQPPAMAPMM